MKQNKFIKINGMKSQVNHHEVIERDIEILDYIVYEEPMSGKAEHAIGALTDDIENTPEFDIIEKKPYLERLNIKA